MKAKNDKSFLNKVKNLDLSYFLIGFVAFIFADNAFNNDKHTESYTHLIWIIFCGYMMVKLSRDRIKESDELEKKIELEIISKTYSIVMPILFCVGYGILKFAKLHYEAQITGLVFTVFLTAQFIIRVIVHKKYS